MKGLQQGAADTIAFRTEVMPSDPGDVRDIVSSTGFFSDEEIEVAVELVDERMARGEASGYHFVFAETDGDTVGYACFGPIPFTKSSWDLYWIAVRNEFRGRGLGRLIMEKVQAAVMEMGGSRIYIDTSLRAQYAPTRVFYESCGYGVDAVQQDFYAPGDSKVIYVKILKG